MNIIGVPSTAVRTIWPHVEEYFASFEERAQGEVTAEELLSLVEAQHRQCWIAADNKKVWACALTRVDNNPLGTVQLDFCAGEDRDKWRDKLVHEIERWAAHRGAGRVRIICRPGWTKELRKLGYRETHRVLEKEMGNG
jgi:hypothetical protein